uniref:RING-type domain-containing protein n=1 Tax=Catagonus wagneri TaxID=51154 RepID=A0A8C3W3F8_9CETA
MVYQIKNPACVREDVGLFPDYAQCIKDPVLLKAAEECAICTLDFVCGDPIRSLPCKHFYHLGCIDEGLIRSFTCPCCRGPADGPKPSSQGTH